MRTSLKLNLILSMIGGLILILPLLSMPHRADASQTYEVIASGLDNPRGLAFGPEGALYVTEGGTGGNGPCAPVGCYGPTGAITRIWQGEQERIVTGLPSYAPSDGSRAYGGPQDIAFLGRGTAYVTMGFCWTPNDACGRLFKLPASNTLSEVADLSVYEIENNPDGLLIQSNPYAVLALPGEQIVADAAANDLLRIDANGTISTLAVFPKHTESGFLVDSVPTTVAVGPDGAFYVGELTGAPYPVGGARIYRVVPGEAPQVYADGFTNVIDIAFADDGSLFVLELATNSLASGDLTGALIRLKPDGSRETLMSAGLVAPMAVAIGDDGAIYISNYGVYADLGEVIRLEPFE